MHVGTNFADRSLILVCVLPTSSRMASVASNNPTSAHPAHIQRQSEYDQLLKSHCNRRCWLLTVSSRQTLAQGCNIGLLCIRWVLRDVFCKDASVYTTLSTHFFIVGWYVPGLKCRGASHPGKSGRKRSAVIYTGGQ